MPFGRFAAAERGGIHTTPTRAVGLRSSVHGSLERNLTTLTRERTPPFQPTS